MVVISRVHLVKWTCNNGPLFPSAQFDKPLNRLETLLTFRYEVKNSQVVHPKDPNIPGVRSWRLLLVYLALISWLPELTQIYPYFIVTDSSTR